MRLLRMTKYPEWTLKRKLFGYMLLLAAVLILTVMVGFFLLGRFVITQKDVYDTLDVQMEVFERDVETHFDHLFAASIRLSYNMSQMLEEYFADNDASMRSITDSADDIAALQEKMIEHLSFKLLQEECSGVFVMLDTTINSALENSDLSRTGIYLQINGYEDSSDNMLLYRGSSNIAKRHGIMPHRKWRLEFRTDLFPNYDKIMELSSALPERAYYLTDLFKLPGTSDEVMLLVSPMKGSDGSFLGVCGYEVSKSFFMTHHAQPSKLDHMVCLLSPGDGNELYSSMGLSCGISKGYYRAPSGVLTLEGERGGLLTFSGDSVPYIGITRPISFTPNNEDSYLSVMLLKDDYDRSVRKSTLQNLLLLVFVLFFAVNCCLFFSRRFLSPLLKGLEQLKSDRHAGTNIPEIDDLFEFLAEKDRKYEEKVNDLIRENRTAISEKESLLRDHEKAQQRLDELLLALKVKDRQHEEALLSLDREKREIQREKDKLISENISAQGDRDELLSSLYEKELEYEESLKLLTREKNELIEQVELAKANYAAAQENLSRIAYKMRQEIDPDDYQCFLNGIRDLTAAERKIFDLYFDGKSAKEILDILQIKENTLKYHNKGIYSKLGVSSRKQLLQYASLMKQQNENGE